MNFKDCSFEQLEALKEYAKSNADFLEITSKEAKGEVKETIDHIIRILRADIETMERAQEEL